jgi:hypothetical protein
MKKQSATLKIGTPEIRVGLEAAKPKSSMMKVKKLSGKPMMTNDASDPTMPKEKKRLVKMPKRMKKM